MKLKAILSSAVLAAAVNIANAKPVNFTSTTESSGGSTADLENLAEFWSEAYKEALKNMGPYVLNYRIKTNGQRVHMRNQDGSLYTDKNGVPQYFADGHTVSVDVTDESNVNGKTLYRVFVKGQPTNKFIDSSLLNYEIK